MMDEHPGLYVTFILLAFISMTSSVLFGLLWYIAGKATPAGVILLLIAITTAALAVLTYLKWRLQ